MAALRKYLPCYLVQVNDFYRQVRLNAHKAILLSILLVLSLLLLAIKMVDLPSTRLLAPVQVNGQPLNESLELPLYQQAEVLAWADLAVSHLFDLSYQEQKRVLNELKFDYLTARGFREFYLALKQIDMLDWLSAEGHASIFVPEEQSVIRQGVSSTGAYKWRLLVKGRLVLLNRSDQIKIPYQLTIDILRVTQLGHETALRIDRVIAEKRQES